MSRSLIGVVLAAGTSSRMGANKLLLPRAGGPMIRIVCERVVAAGLERVILVLGHECERVEPIVADLPLDIVVNAEYRSGMASSVAAGVRAADDSSGGYMFALGDMPEVRIETFRLLRETFEQCGAQDIVVPNHEGQRGNPVIFARRYRDELLGLDGDRGARRLLGAHADHVLSVAVDDPGILVDYDEPHQQ